MTPRRAVAAALLFHAAWAGTRSFVLETPADFAAGEAEGVLVGPGEMQAGYSATPVKVDAAAVWCALEAPDGTVYLGTGDDGRLLALSGGRVREIARLDAVMVTSLAWGRGRLYAGTMPKGIIYVFDRSGKWRELVRLDAQHVWALYWDDGAGVLYAATGPEGKLFAVDPSGKARVHYDSEQKHLLSIAPAPDGGVYVGSGDSAILYRVDRDGRAFALRDFDGDEVRALAVGPGGTIFAAVNEFEHPRGVAPSLPPKPPGPETAPPPPAPPSAAAAPRRPTERPGRGAVYRVDATGTAEKLHALVDGYFTALSAEPDGAVWAAAGTDGRVYFIDAARNVFTALDFPERQVLALAFGRERIAATGDAGAVYRIGRGPPARPEYRSRVLDAAFPARWGRLRWRADGLVLVHTRGGNTATPGPLWSPWVPLQGNGHAGGEYWGDVASPQARYLQIRVTWPGGTRARVGSLTAFYVPQNQRARVVEVKADGDAAAPSPPVVSPPGTPPAKAGRPPVVKLRWKVDNPDGDALVYRLAYREEGGGAWQPIAREPVDKTDYDWNTESVADGTYRVRVTASDEAANPADLALDDSKVSGPVLVDNRKPEVRSLDVGGGRAAGRAVDATSPLTALEFSVDGGPWRPVAPRDGLFDDLVEDFAFALPALPAGTHVLAVRATDGAGNVGVEQTSFRTR
jgi:hypothetical protein